ncbi:MAG: transporter [Pseudomonadota bacterium]
MNKTRLMLATLLVAAPFAHADHDQTTRADAHAPIGVMGDHTHDKGEWMFSYRFMSMPMEGNLSGSDSISPDQIATTVPNRFFGNPGQPPTLRVVPVEMNMDMHMFGVMYAPTDRITVMGMVNYIQKDMDHLTYQGGMGTAVLGTFMTETSGIGDTTVSALIDIGTNPDHKLHGIVGLSVPTGSIDETDDILTPMNMRPTIRLPYPMQLGSGSWDPILGLSYSGFAEHFNWGTQWRSTFRVADNDENYRLGDLHHLTGWAGYSFSDAVSVALRLAYTDQGEISGRDPLIAGPVQTADPDRFGGSRWDAGVSLNIAGQGDLEGWRLAIEYLVPVEQDLNGPQLETQEMLTFGIQKSW